MGADPLERPRSAPPPPPEYADDPIAGYGPAPPSDAPGLPIGPDEVAAALSGLGDGLAILTHHEHWRIEPAEVALPSAAIARQLAKPDTALAAWLAAHADALLIVVGLGVVIVPRALIEWQWISYEREQRRMARAQQQHEVPTGYDYEPEPAPEPGSGATTSGARGGVSPARAEGAAAGIPTDSDRLAAAVASVIG
jgi:hypothetical protein